MFFSIVRVQSMNPSASQHIMGMHQSLLLLPSYQLHQVLYICTCTVEWENQLDFFSILLSELTLIVVINHDEQDVNDNHHGDLINDHDHDEQDDEHDDDDTWFSV